MSSIGCMLQQRTLSSSARQNRCDRASARPARDVTTVMEAPLTALLKACYWIALGSEGVVNKPWGLTRTRQRGIRRTGSGCRSKPAGCRAGSATQMMGKGGAIRLRGGTTARPEGNARRARPLLPDSRPCVR